MESNNAPFEVGQKVVCISDDWVNKADFIDSPVKRGGVYIINHVEYMYAHLCWYIGFEEDPMPDRFYWAKRFAPYNPYSNSVSKELAEQAMKPVIEIDQPVKELQPAN